MIGTKKRRDISLRSSDIDDPPALSKRVLADSPFNGERAEPSQQPATATPTLDVGRAEASRRHVRALNTQFASWVQSQLQNHPDELWEDGLRDYLAHASEILVKFSDVVSWIKANAAKGRSQSSLGSQTAENKLALETKSNDEKLLPGKSISVPSTSNSGLSSTWSSGVSFLNQGSPTTTPGPATSSSPSPLAFTTASFTSPLTSGTFSAGQMPSFGGSTSFLTSQDPPFGIKPSFSTSPDPSFGIKTSFSTSQDQSFGTKTSFSTSQTPLFGANKSLLPGHTPSFGSSTGFSSSQTPSFGLSTGFSTSQIPAFGGSTSFSTSMSSGVFSNNSATFQLGSPQNSAPGKEEATDDGDAENEQPSSPSVKRTEENGVIVVHEVKCRLYMKPADPADKDPWKDRGSGTLSVRRRGDGEKGTKESKPVVILCTDTGKILLNASIYTGIKLNLPKKNCIVAIFHTASDDGSSNEVVARTCLIKTKDEGERNKLADIIKEHAPAA